MNDEFGITTEIIGEDVGAAPAVMRLAAPDVLPALTLYWPFDPRPIYVTQPFRPPHYGLDIGIPNGVAYYSPMPVRSQIVIAGWNDQGYGNMVGLKADEIGAYVIIAHMQRVNPDLRAGAWVDPWGYLGTSDSTGNSTGPHLHLELRRGSGYYPYPSACVNPYPLLKWRGALPEPPKPPPPAGSKARTTRNAPIIKKNNGKKVGLYPGGVTLAIGRVDGKWTYVPGQYGQPDGWVKTANLARVN